MFLKLDGFTQHTFCTLRKTGISKEINYKSATAVDVSKCLKHIEVPSLFLMSAPYNELPAYTSELQLRIPIPVLSSDPSWLHLKTRARAWYLY